MPAHPNTSPTLEALSGSVYSGLAERAARAVGPDRVYPFHVGDTWMQTAPGCRLQDFTVADHPGMHRYTAIQGSPSLIEAIRTRQQERMQLPIAADEVLVTSSGSSGIAHVLGAIAAPGDEVLILAPYWPLVAGAVRLFHATPVPVPFFGSVDSAEAAVAALEAHTGPRTVAVYWNTPHNPTGRVIPRPWLEAITAWAVDRGLWIVADEVYEDYCYAGPHTYTRPLAPAHTFSVHSFSKAYGMTGNRVGYTIGPAAAMGAVRKVHTHAVYSAPTGSQLAAEAAIRGVAQPWVDHARAEYQRIGTWAAERLGVAPPEGGTFLFLDVSPALDEGGLGGFLERCADVGVLVAPGPSFGPYPSSVRLCFTATEPETTRRGVTALAAVLGRDSD